MDLQYSLPTSTTIMFFTICFILIPLYSFLIFRLKKKSSKLPPGPMKIPIIGNLHNFVGSKLPHHTLRDLSKKYGPLMHLKLGEVSTLIVSSPDMAREFMKTHDLSFADRPQLLAVQVANYGGTAKGIIFAPYGEYWRQMKKVGTIELLSSKRVQTFSSIREDEAQNLVETIESSPMPVNLSQSLVRLMGSIVCRVAFGSKCHSEDVLTLISGIKEGTLLAGGFNLADLYPSMKFIAEMSPLKAKMMKILVKGTQALENIIQMHMLDEIRAKRELGEKESEDLVDVLLGIQRSGSLEIPITNHNINAVISDLLAGGTETTSTTVEWAMAELMKNPRMMQKAQAEIRQALKGKRTIDESDIQGLSYLKLVIKETLRLHPPAPLLLPRECREPCIINGYEIPVNTRVIINAWAIGRDPMYWGSDAENFVPERFIDSSVDYKGTHYEFIPFGAGRRMCPGIAFGIASVEIALSKLLYHFDWNLPAGMKPENLDMTELFGANVGLKHHLHLIPVSFVPPAKD